MAGVGDWPVTPLFYFTKCTNLRLIVRSARCQLWIRRATFKLALLMTEFPHVEITDAGFFQELRLQAAGVEPGVRHIGESVECAAWLGATKPG